MDQILDDIEEGKIVPYESSEEICEDLKSGRITTHEAFMFAAALDRYSPSASSEVNAAMLRDLEQECGEVDDVDDDYQEGDDEGQGHGDSRGDLVSYNPNGFGGCGGGRYDSGGNWNTDDEV